MGNSAIVSLAILKVNYDENRDYLDTFLPMVGECIRISEYDTITILDIQESMKKNFYLDIPQHAIKALLNKAYRAKYLRKENLMFIRNSDVLKELNFNKVRTEMLKKQSDLIEDLIIYVEDKFNVKWENNNAEKYLLKFIEHNQIMSFKRKIILDEAEINIGNKEKLYVARYIEDLIDRKPHLFEYLEEVLKGLIISTVVFLNEPSEIKKSFKNMSIYFDTTFIIYALGYAGENKRIQCDELLKLVYENNIRAKCFKHTIDEVRGALTACAYRVEGKDRYQAYGHSMEYFIEMGMSKSDIILMINTLEDDLSKINIKIEETPEYNNKCYIDEEELKLVLKKNITYAKDQAIDRDIKSISAITILRNGRKTQKIEDSSAIFVTTNLKLVREVNKYLNINEELTGIMPIISDYALTNLLWLKKPLKSNDLSRKRIIAECFAATQPDEVLWNKYIAQVDKLRERGYIAEDESHYFKYAPIVKTICMEVTNGEDDVVSEGTALEVMKRAREAISRQEAEKLSKDMDKIKLENSQKSEEIRMKNNNISQYAKTEADRVKKVVKCGLIIGGFLLVFLSQDIVSSYLGESFTKYAKSIEIIFFLVAVISYIIFTIKGETIDSISEKISRKKYDDIMKKINKDKEDGESELEVALDRENFI